MTQEPMNAHDLARLALEAQPHLDLLERIGGHLDMVLRLSAVLKKDWVEMDDALRAAALAPEPVKAAFHRTTFEHYGRLYGLTPELLGALAHERRKADPTPARPGSLVPVTAEEVDRAFEEPAKHPPVSRRMTSEQRAAHLETLEAIQALLNQTPAPASVITARVADLGVRINRTVVSAIRGGSVFRYLREGKPAGAVGVSTAQELRAALELLLDPARTDEPRLPLKFPRRTPPPIEEVICPPSAPPVPAEKPSKAPQKKDDVDPALLTTRKDRERYIRDCAQRGQGRVKASEIKQALGVPYGAAVGIIKDIPGTKHVSQDLWSVPTN